MKAKDIPILMYHEISEVENPWCVSPAAFAAQIRWLQVQGWKTISLRELQSALAVDAEVEKSVVITFDDAR